MLVLLAILTLVTSAAVAGGTYLLAQRLSGPIRVLRNSLKELANGRYDYRIAETRNDEFGELYADFDRTAAALEQRHEPPAPGTGARRRASVLRALGWLVAGARRPRCTRRPRRAPGGGAGAARRTPARSSRATTTSRSWSPAPETVWRRWRSSTSATRGKAWRIAEFNGIAETAARSDRS